VKLDLDMVQIKDFLFNFSNTSTSQNLNFSDTIKKLYLINVTFVGNYVENFSFNLKNLDLFALLGLKIYDITFNNSCIFNISNATNLIIENVELS
jgi:hypothetical protein